MKTLHSVPALSDHRSALSADDLQKTLRRAANGLVALSEERSHPVAVVAENSVEVLIAHTAACMAGVTTVAVNPRLSPAELEYILADSGASAVLTDSRAGDVAVRHIVTWGSSQTGAISWEQWLSAANPAEPEADVPPAHAIVYTSGTTGRPKATKMISVRPGSTATTLVRAYAENAVASDAGPHLVVGPLHHASPLVAMRYVLAGTPVVVLPRFDAEAMLSAIDRFGVASTMVVPTHLNRLVRLPEEVRRRYDVSSLRWVCHTGAPCSPATKRACIDWFGPVVVEVYGSSESGLISVIDSHEWLAKPGSVGRVVRRFETIVVDENGETLPAGQVGRLYFRDRTGRGIVYEGDPDKTAAAHLEPGVFTIGELGFVDGDGYLFIADRGADLILCGGANVYPAEIEKTLFAHPRVADAVCIGVPDDDLGEIVHALIQPDDPDDPPTPDELLEFCATRLARYKHPRAFELVAAIERDAMGKVNRRRLRDRFLTASR